MWYGRLGFPPAVIVSITIEPESDEVTKNTRTRIIPRNDVTEASGSPANRWKSFNSKAASLMGSAASAITREIAVPPKALIQTKQTMVGNKITQKMNSRIVRPREILAMNMPTKGAQEIHQPQ